MWNSATPYLPCFYYGQPIPWCPFLAAPSMCGAETATVVGKPPVSPSLIGCSQSSVELEPLMEETTAKPRVEEKKRNVKKEKLLKKREREDNFEKKKQKKDRNLPSNIFRNFASFIHSHPRPQALFPTLPNSPSSLNPTSFLLKLKHFIRQNQTYIRPALIQSLWKGNDFTTQQALAFRVLLNRFLQVELPVMVATMGKLKKMQKTAYLRLARKLNEQLRKQHFL